MSTAPVEGESVLRASGLWVAARRSFDRVALALVLLVVVWWWVVLAVQGPPADWAFDFRQFWQGGRDVVDGVSPYPSSALLATAGAHLDPEGIREVFRFPYPAGAAVALAPLGALEFQTAAALWSALLIVALLASLAILGVRDWRVLAIVVTAAPVISSVRLGTFTPVLVLALAIMWRWRDRPWISGAALGAAVALKLFLWPLAVWLLATRRYAAAGIAAGVAALATLGAWAAIGFAGLTEYPELLRRLADVVAERGFSLVALGVQLGLPSALASALPWIVGLPLLGWIVVAGRRRSGERTTFTLAIVAVLTLTPIVWLHYVTLLVVPLAIMRPRLAWSWLPLWVFWLMPAQENQGELWRIAMAVALVGISSLAGVRAPLPRQLQQAP